MLVPAMAIVALMTSMQSGGLFRVTPFKQQYGKADGKHDARQYDHDDEFHSILWMKMAVGANPAP
jgi:hypothetical protein